VNTDSIDTDFAFQASRQAKAAGVARVTARSTPNSRDVLMSTITTTEGRMIFFKDWGAEARTAHRVPPWVAAERRRLGHPDAVLPEERGIGSSRTTGAGMAARARWAVVTTWTTTPTVVTHLDLRNAIHVGHSTGGGEATH
jgi:non-heme chloroperoxidase